MPLIEANGERISFVDAGEGPAVLFIHSLGTNAWLYADQIAALKGRYRCIAPDCRAHGATSYNKPGFSVADLAADHKAVLDHLGVAKAHVVGLSMGGPVAFNFNTAYPGVALSMTIADSFARPGAPEAVQDRIYATQEAVAYLSMLEFGNQYAGDRLMPSTPIERLDELAAEIAKCPPKGYVDTCRAIFTYDARDDLKNVKVPTLVLIGEQDEATPMPASEFIRDSIPGSVLKTIPNAGHLSTIDNPDAFTAALAAFLDAQGK